MTKVIIGGSMQRLLIIIMVLAYKLNVGVEKYTDLYVPALFLCTQIMDVRIINYPSKFIYTAASYIWPEFGFFLPAYAYEQEKNTMPLLALFIPLIIKENMYLIGIMTLLTAYIKLQDTKYGEMLESYIISGNRLNRERDESLSRNINMEKERFRDMEIAKYEERNRISRALHDSVGHTVSSAIIQVEAMKYMTDNPELLGGLSDLKENLSQGMDEIRSALYDLHSDSFILTEKLKLLAEPSGEKIDMEISLISPVSGTLAYDIYGIVREGITNFNKHSNGSELKVKIIENPGFIVLSISDNGTSALNSKKKMGIGLMGIEDTVLKHGGSLTIDSSNGYRLHAILRRSDL